VPLDVSPDGEHVAYYAQTFGRRVKSYVGVSRPPHFRALLFYPCFHLAPVGVLFGLRNELAIVADPEEEHPLRVDPGCPFDLTIFDRDLEEDRADVAAIFEKLSADRPRLGDKIAIWHYTDEAREPKSRSHWPTRFLPAIESILVPGVRDGQVGIHWDPGGRLIVCPGDGKIYAIDEESEPALLMDLKSREFEEVVPPVWAHHWRGKRTASDRPAHRCRTKAR
jgi:hypothetical protein